MNKHSDLTKFMGLVFKVGEGFRDDGQLWQSYFEILYAEGYDLSAILFTAEKMGKDNPQIPFQSKMESFFLQIVRDAPSIYVKEIKELLEYRHEE